MPEEISDFVQKEYREYQVLQREIATIQRKQSHDCDIIYACSAGYLLLEGLSLAFDLNHAFVLLPLVTSFGFVWFSLPYICEYFAEELISIPIKKNIRDLEKKLASYKLDSAGNYTTPAHLKTCVGSYC